MTGERLNVRLLAVLLVGAGVASAAVAGVHRWQVRRQAAGLLVLADTAEAAGRTDRAARLVGDYLSFAPADAAARGRYARLLDGMAGDGKGLAAVADEYERALEANPADTDARARLAKVYVRLGRYPEALAHLTALRAAAGADAQLVELVAVCQDVTNDAAAAEKTYRRALELDPKPVGRSLRLAALLRRAGSRGTEADAVIDRMVSVNPDDAAAHLARARYRMAHQSGDPADDLRAAERLAPADADVRLTAAEAAADPAAARRHLRTALDHHPNDLRVYMALAGVEAAAGDAVAAGDLLRKAAARRPGDPLPLFALAELGLETRDAAAAERALAELDRWKHAPHRVAVLRGRLRMTQGDWPAARAVLDAARPLLTTADAKLAAEADVLLGKCHEQLGEDDLALAAYRRAEAGDPGRGEAAAGAARALVRGGRLGEAVDQYRRLTAAPGAGPETRLLYARLRTLQYLSTPPASRRPADIAPVFEETAAKVPGSAELVILRAEVLAADRRPAEAEKLLKAAAAEKPAALELTVPLAQLLARQGKPADAWAALDAHERAAGPSVGLAVVRLQLLPTAADPRAEPAARAAEQLFTRPATGPADQARLAEALADAKTRWGDPAAARRWWAEVAGRRPHDFGVRFRVFDLAVTTGDRAGMEEAVRDIRRAEGELGPVGHYAEAVLRLVRQKPPTADDLREAREHLAAAALARPTWSVLPAARAAVALAEQRPDDALAEYLRAVELGERRPAVVRQAVRLLFDRRRYAEADRLIQRIGPDGYLSGELGRLAAEVSLFNLQTDRAVELAGAAVAPGSKRYEDHLWQADLLAAANKGDEATAAYRRAVAVADGAGRPWVALVRHLTRTGKKADAEAAVGELARRAGDQEASLAAAQCNELLGRTEQAAAGYQAAAEARPADLETVRQLAGFCERAGRPGDAVPALRRLLADRRSPAADQPAARRLLAAALAASGDYAAFREALGLLDQNPGGTPDDLTAKARVLATRLPHRREALAALQQAQRLRPLDPDGEFFLAQLLADTGAWPDGRRRLVDLLSRNADDPARLGFLVDRLLKNNQPEEAGVWLDRLERAAADAPEAVRLRVTWLAMRSDGRAAADRLRRWVPPAADRDRVRAAAGMAAAAARRYEGVRAAVGPVAEELYRRAADGGTPADRLALAGCLAARGKVDEALDLCKAEEPAAGPTAVAAALVGIAYLPLPDAQLAAVEHAVAGLLPRVEPPAVRDAVAGAVAARSGRYPEAADAFRRAGTDPAMLNNTAYMLVLTGARNEEVEALIARAVAAAGPSAELMDTRGAGRLAAGRTAEAVADLEVAVDQEPTAARCLHLAAAYRQAGRRADAARLLAKVETLRHDGSLLVPAEEQAYRKLTGELVTRGGQP